MLKKMVFTLTFVFVLGLINGSGALAGDANLDGKVDARDFGTAQSGGSKESQKEPNVPPIGYSKGWPANKHWPSNKPRTKGQKDMRLKGSKINSNNKIQPKSQKRATNFGVLPGSDGDKKHRLQRGTRTKE